jgi:hypothetical protein
VDPVALVLDALTSGAAQGVADSASDAAGTAYTRLKCLVADQFAGHRTAEIALAEHASDPQTWRAPLAKALAATGAAVDESVLGAAQELLKLLDAPAVWAGKPAVDITSSQGVQVGERNQQVNIYSGGPSGGVAPIRPGQPRNEAAFGPVYEAAGGAASLGPALGEVYEEGPGFVQHFSGGPDSGPAVICALFGHVPVAVTQEVWNALRAVGGRGGGTAGAGFPATEEGQAAYLRTGATAIELVGGSWGPGQLYRMADGGWRWRPHIAFDSQAYQDQDTWSSRGEEMDLRLRVAVRIPVLTKDPRITGAGRSRMLTALQGVGKSGMIKSLATRYGLETGELTWEETAEPAGYNDTLRAAYHYEVAGHDGRPALRSSLWLTLPHQYQPARAIVDLSVDFDAVSPASHEGTPASIPVSLKMTPGEIAAFFSWAWQAAMILPLAGIKGDLLDLPPDGPVRAEFYIQNQRPENSGGIRSVRTLDMVDFTVFGPTRRTRIGNMSVGITAPLGLGPEETTGLTRQALIRIAEDHAFTKADTAEI